MPRRSSDLHTWSRNCLQQTERASQSILLAYTALLRHAQLKQSSVCCQLMPQAEQAQIMQTIARKLMLMRIGPSAWFVLGQCQSVIASAPCLFNHSSVQFMMVSHSLLRPEQGVNSLGQQRHSSGMKYSLCSCVSVVQCTDKKGLSDHMPVFLRPKPKRLFLGQTAQLAA